MNFVSNRRRVFKLKGHFGACVEIKRPWVAFTPTGSAAFPTWREAYSYASAYYPMYTMSVGSFRIK